MDILNNKSLQMVSFFTALDELSATIQQDLQNRTPHLNGEKYLTNREVCQLLHISSRTLQNWRDTGKIPFIRLQGKILYRESDIVKWIKHISLRYRLVYDINLKKDQTIYFLIHVLYISLFYQV